MSKLSKQDFEKRLERLRGYPLSYEQLDEAMDLVSRWLIEAVAVIEQKDEIIEQICERDESWFELATEAYDLKLSFLQTEQLEETKQNGK